MIKEYQRGDLVRVRMDRMPYVWSTDEHRGQTKRLLNGSRGVYIRPCTDEYFGNHVVNFGAGMGNRIVADLILEAM